MDNQIIFKRYELKYLMTRQQRDVLLREVGAHLTEDRFRHSSIRNLYYDTQNFRLIRDSLDRPIYKEKLRIRSYGQAGLEDPVFLELKKKYDSVVYKRRIALPLWRAVDGISGEVPLPDCQIAKEIQSTLQFYGQLEPRVYLSYERDSYRSAGEEDLRVTFDDQILFRTTDLRLNTEAWGTPLLDEDSVLMELKVGASIPLWLTQALSELQIYKTTFSKYGAAYRQMNQIIQKGAKQYA